VRQLQENDAGTDPHNQDRGIDPRWNLTYEFTSAPTRRETDGAHVLWVSVTADTYPGTPQARRDLVRRYGPYLVDEWAQRRLPAGDLYHLVHRPGDLGPSEGQRIHCADQASALARENGGVPVVVALANTPLEPRYVVSRVHFD
jgi:hypothetical protein